MGKNGKNGNENGKENGNGYPPPPRGEEIVSGAPIFVPSGGQLHGPRIILSLRIHAKKQSRNALLFMCCQQKPGTRTQDVLLRRHAALASFLLF